jgi:PAS domain S-box-containing protein
MVAQVPAKSPRLQVEEGRGNFMSLQPSMKNMAGLAGIGRPLHEVFREDVPGMKLLLTLVALLVTIVTVLTTIYSLKTGIFDIFPYFYIIPVLIIAYVRPRFAVYFTILLGWFYLGLVYYYGPFDIRLYAASSAWFYIFVTLGVVVSAFSSEIERERKFRTIFLNSQAGLFIIDPKTESVVVANAQMSAILGYSREELEGFDAKKLFPDGSSYEFFRQQLHNEGRITNQEFFLSKKDGTGVWVLLTASVSPDKEIIVSAIDITEKRKAKDELLFQEIHYRTLFDNAGDAIIIHDFSGHIYEANKIASNMTGFSETELKGRTLADLGLAVPREMEYSWAEDLRRKETIVQEMSLRRRDGSLIPIEMSSKAIEYYRSPSVISIIRDISARKQAEEALRKSEEKYRMIGEMIPFGVWIADGKGMLSYASPSFLELIGMTLEECQKENWMRRLPADIRDQAIADWNRCVEGGYFWDYEYRIPDRQGRDHFVLSRGAPIRDDRGRIVSFAGIHLDITERRRYEERLEASLREKEVIIKEVHHRVKNNMQVISGFLQLQAQTIDDPVSVAMLEECQGRVRTMALVHEKLYQSRYLGFINAREYIESLVSDLKNFQVVSTDVTFDLEIENAYINLDIAIPCGLILNELLTNSLKYAFSGREKGKISVRLTHGNDHTYTLFVSDDGPGLPRDLDIENAQTLGLQLVTILVRQMGGTMRIENVPGATFSIRFPEKF